MFKEHRREHIPSGCAITGFLHEDGKRETGEAIVRSLELMHPRSNGLGGGFVGYGMYPDFHDHYALHIITDSDETRLTTEEFLQGTTQVRKREEIPTREVDGIESPPLIWRYFVKVPKSSPLQEDESMVRLVMHINSKIDGAYVFSSGKNLGVFKGVGYPETIGNFFKLEDYKAHMWIGHGRFPTNTPGWWGGAHPFSLLDWSIVHNGEISSYGTNKRYLEAFGYKLELMTDTEVIAYLFDLLVRKHGLSVEVVSKVFSAPFWEEIDRMPPEEREVFKNLRIVYGSAMLNGPFSVIIGMNDGILGLTDRVKLRPLVAARKDNTLFLSSEESAIRVIEKDLDRVWSPRAGTLITGKLSV